MVTMTAVAAEPVTSHLLNSLHFQFFFLLFVSLSLPVHPFEKIFLCVKLYFIFGIRKFSPRKNFWANKERQRNQIHVGEFYFCIRAEFLSFSELRDVRSWGH